MDYTKINLDQISDQGLNLELSDFLHAELKELNLSELTAQARLEALDKKTLSVVGHVNFTRSIDCSLCTVTTEHSGTQKFEDFLIAEEERKSILQIINHKNEFNFIHFLKELIHLEEPTKVTGCKNQSNCAHYNEYVAPFLVSEKPEVKIDTEEEKSNPFKDLKKLIQ